MLRKVSVFAAGRANNKKTKEDTGDSAAEQTRRREEGALTSVYQG